MRTPASVEKITREFHQDVFLFETTLEGLLTLGIRSLSSQEREEARLFLTSILDGGLSAGEIRNISDRLPKDIRIENDHEMIEFLTHLRNRLNRA